MKIYVLGTRGFPQIQGGVEKHCESLYPLFDNEFKFTVFRRKPYINSSLTYPNIKFIDLDDLKRAMKEDEENAFKELERLFFKK